MLITLSIPAGILRTGTEYQSKGRYYDANLVRSFQGRIRPMGGWRQKSVDGEGDAAQVSGKPRAMLTWKDNSGRNWCGIGTHSHLYAMTRTGLLHDITPEEFVAGRPDATGNGGYGAGAYSAGKYGISRPDDNDDSVVQDASVWTLDTFGEKLIGMMGEGGDGVLYAWAPDPEDPEPAATVHEDAPTGRACFVTEEGMAVVLGADDVPRRVAWSHQRNMEVWEAAATNQAGDFDLQTNGRLMMGKRIRGGSLIFTDTDVHLMSYAGGQLVYGFNKVGDNCGAVSKNCAALLDNQIVWVSRNGLWSYNGFVQPLPCDVWEMVSSDINWRQRSKITVEVDSAFGEFIIRYCSSGSTEIDREIRWNYREGHWNVGAMERTAGVDRSPQFQYPLRAAADGAIYEHEYAFDYGGATPFIETGPLELGEGDRTIDVLEIVPDEKTTGDIRVTFKVRFHPNGAESSFGPYTLSELTSVRVTGRQIKVRYEGARDADWTIGNFRYDWKPGSGR